MAAVAAHVARGDLRRSSRSEVLAEVRTIGDLLAAWTEVQQRRERPVGAPRGTGLAATTVDCYEKASRHLTAWLGDLRPEQLTEESVEGYILDRQHRDMRPASPRTVELEVRIFRMAWKWARKRRLICDRAFPEARVRVDGKVFTINHETPQPGDAAKVLAAMSGEPALVLRMLAVTGARVGAACTLKVDDVDIVNGTVAFDWKNGRRTFPLRAADTELFALLVGRVGIRDRGANVFDLGTCPREQVRSALKRACARADVPRFTPHGLRRMVVTRLIHTPGVDVATAASLLGHSPVVMLRKYAQVSDEARAAAVAAARLGVLSPGAQVIEGPWDKPSSQG